MLVFISLLSLLFTGVFGVPHFFGPKPFDCDFDNGDPMYPVALYDRLIVAATDITNINNNPFAVIDPLHGRMKGFGYTQSEVDQMVVDGLGWFYEQFCFNFTGVSPSSFGSYSVPGLTAYPYASLPTFSPIILIDNAYPKRQNGYHFWKDYGLLALTSSNGTFQCGPLQGKTYPAGAVIWYTYWDELRDNITMPNGRVVPGCRVEQFVSRSMTPSIIAHNIEGDAEQILRAQLITRNGYVGYYNDMIAIVYGMEGEWEGIGAKWETSRLVVTWDEYVRP